MIEIKDPLAVTLNQLARSALADPSSPKPVPFLLEIHGKELTEQPGFVQEITELLKSIVSGLRICLSSLLLLTCALIPDVRYCRVNQA